MLQIQNLDEYSEKDIPALEEKVSKILNKRRSLHDKYSRGASDTNLMYSENNGRTKIPFEKFITDLATGYLGGEPVYSVNVSKDKKKNDAIQKYLDKEAKTEDYAEGMKAIIDDITDYNDDGQENHDLLHDILELTSCYEVIYENEDNEIVYSRYSPLQTVATWDYSIPANLTGLVRIWEEADLSNKTVKKIELTDKNGSRTYRMDNKREVEEESREDHSWNDVPAFAVETDFAIFEPCEDIIMAYEQLIQNVRNTFQYNDSDCKLMLTNYVPENPIMTVDDSGNEVINPARVKEDQRWIDAKTVYVGQDGKVEWLIKPVDANGVETVLKTYIDLLFLVAGIPNTSDLAFNSTDLNASAIDRKFYVMNMATISVIALLKKAYLRRWELIFNRINLKKSTKFDFRDIVIDIPKNLPANQDEMVESILKLRDLLSEQTILDKLGYDYESEKEKKDQESTENIMTNMERFMNLKNDDSDNEEPEDEEVNDEKKSENTGSPVEEKRTVIQKES